MHVPAHAGGAAGAAWAGATPAPALTRRLAGPHQPMGDPPDDLGRLRWCVTPKLTRPSPQPHQPNPNPLPSPPPPPPTSPPPPFPPGVRALDTCGMFFDKGSAKRRLDVFLVRLMPHFFARWPRTLTRTLTQP